MNLYFLRHGEAGKRLTVAARDYQRTLTATGREEMEEIGEALGKLGFEFDMVATSPLKRARDSAAIVSKALGRKGEVEDWPELSPEGSREALYKRLAKVKAGSSVLCVGHEPYLTTAIGEIINRGGTGSAGSRIALKKGGLAKVSVSAFSPRISGELRWLLTPNQVKRLA